MNRLPALILALLISGCAGVPLYKPSSEKPVPSETAPARPLNEPQVTAIPNPVRGKKVAFRVLADGNTRVRIKIYDHFLVEIKTLEQEGMGLFDILWDFKHLEEGIYYYQANVEDKKQDHLFKLKIQKLVVLKEEPKF